MTESAQHPFLLSELRELTGKFGLLFPNKHYIHHGNKDEIFRNALRSMLEKARYAKLRYLEYIPDPENDPKWVIQVNWQGLGFEEQNTHVYTVELNHDANAKFPKNNFQIAINETESHDIDAIEALLQEILSDVSAIKITEKYLKSFLEHGTIVSVHDRSNTSKPLIGMGTLLIPKGSKSGYLKDIIRNPLYKENNIGKIIIRMLLIIAKSRNLKNLTLTNDPQRNGSHALYIKEGFTFLEDVKPYRLSLKDTDK